MKRYGICKLAVVLTLGTLALAAGEAQAQYIKYGPSGEVGIRNWMGTYTWIYPSRFSPGANVPVPGTVQPAPGGLGVIYQGQDGLPHGTYMDSTTGDIVAFSTKKSSGFNGFLEESGTQQPPIPAMPNQGNGVRRHLQGKGTPVVPWNAAKAGTQSLPRKSQVHVPGFRRR